MTNLKTLIFDRLTKNLSPEVLKVLDESQNHVGHANYNGGGHHFAIEIKSKTLSTLSRIDAHKKIYQILNDLIPNEIHAIRIEIIRD